MAVMPPASTTISERRPIAVPISWMTPSSIYIESAARTGFFKSPVSRTPMFLIRTDFVENCSGGIGKDPRKDDSEQNRRQSFEEEKPFPAGESSDAVHSQKDSGERTAKNGRCRNRHQEPGENSRAVFFRKPARQVSLKLRSAWRQATLELLMGCR